MQAASLVFLGIGSTGLFIPLESLTVFCAVALLLWLHSCCPSRCWFLSVPPSDWEGRMPGAPGAKVALLCLTSSNDPVSGTTGRLVHSRRQPDCLSGQVGNRLSAVGASK